FSLALRTVHDLDPNFDKTKLMSINQAKSDYKNDILPNKKIEYCALSIKSIKMIGTSITLHLCDQENGSLVAALHRNCQKSQAIAQNNIILLKNCSLISLNEGRDFFLNIVAANLIASFQISRKVWIGEDVQNSDGLELENYKSLNDDVEGFESSVSDFDISNLKSQFGTPSKAFQDF
ncbi:MAG: hypothetical protein MHPSP_002441, partial [Paramarteilia canceri]